MTTPVQSMGWPGTTPPDTMSQGSPAFRELTRIYQGALAERAAGRDPNAFVRQQGGTGSGLRTLNDVSDALHNGLSAEEYPQRPQQRGWGILSNLINRAGLGWPARLSPALRGAAATSQTGDPANAAVASRLGSLIPYGLAAATDNPLLAGARTGAAGGVEALSDTPPNATLGQQAASFAGGAAVTGLPALLGMSLLHGMAARVSPAGESGENLLELGASELPGPGTAKERVLRLAQQEEGRTPGVPPLLAEINPRFMQVATRGAPLQAPEVRPALIRQAADALDVAQNAKRQVGSKYGPILDAPVNDARVMNVLQDPDVQAAVQRMRKMRVFPQQGDIPITGRALNDIRMHLGLEGQDLLEGISQPGGFDVEKRALGVSLASHARELNDVLRELPGFSDVQAEYGPYAERVAIRQNMLHKLEGPGGSTMPLGRGTGLPPLPATEVKKQIAYHFAPGGIRGGDQWFARVAQAKGLAKAVLLPAQEGLEQIEHLWPWWHKTPVAAVGSAAASPLIHPVARLARMAAGDTSSVNNNP